MGAVVLVLVLVLALVGCGPATSAQVPPLESVPVAVDVRTPAPVAELVASLVVTTQRPPDSWPTLRQSVHGRRPVQTRDGVSVAVWSELLNDEVRLWAQWGQADARIIDQVQTTPTHAAQSGRSLYDVVAVAHGLDAVAVAWRPLVDVAHPQQAELRWGTMSVSGDVGWQSESLRAQTLGATTGIGPYIYAPSRLRAAEIGERAVFVWVGDTGVRAVLADSTTPIALPMRSMSELHLDVVDGYVRVIGNDYWCANGTTHSSSCRSMEQMVLTVNE